MTYEGVELRECPSYPGLWVSECGSVASNCGKVRPRIILDNGRVLVTYCRREACRQLIQEGNTYQVVADLMGMCPNYLSKAIKRRLL